MAVKVTKNTNTKDSTSTNDIIEDDIEYANEMLSKLYTDYRKQNLDSCNIQIIINGNKSIYTHKLVLQTYSNFFRKMIGTEKIISLNDPEINIKTMKLLLRYLYKGVFKTNSEKYFMRVKRLAKKLEINDLYKALSKFQKDSSGNYELISRINNRKSKRMDKSLENVKKEDKINRKSKKKAKSNKSLAMDSKSTSSRKKVNRKVYDSHGQYSKRSTKSKKLMKHVHRKSLKNSIGENETNNLNVSSSMKDLLRKEKNVFDNYESHPLMYSGQKDNYKLTYINDEKDDLRKSESAKKNKKIKNECMY